MQSIFIMVDFLLIIVLILIVIGIKFNSEFVQRYELIKCYDYLGVVHPSKL